MYDLASEETFKKGDTIFKENSAGDWVYLILSGSVEISKTANDKIMYGKTTAYGAEELNQILNAYGVQLSTESAKTLPPNYAKVVNDKIMYQGTTTYTGVELNQILNAYN